MEAVSELVLAPFREIVTKSSAARQNAQNNEQMQKVAAGLAKDGEKALKTLEPLCQKNVDEYGVIFVNAVKENRKLTLTHDRKENIANPSCRGNYPALRATQRLALGFGR